MLFVVIRGRNYMSNIILPSKNGNTKDEYTGSDYRDEILADKIKSTFLNSESTLKFPLLIIDLSSLIDVNVGLMDMLRSFIYTDSDLSEMNSEGQESYVNTYFISVDGKLVYIGRVTERVAYKVLPELIRDVFSSKANLYLSEDGSKILNIKNASNSRIKLRFEE